MQQGNLISNVQLIEYVERHIIDIKPFEPARAQLAHYPLDPETFFEYQAGGWEVAYSFARHVEPYTLEAGRYVLVEVRQHIAPGKGIVGLFVPASNLIEQGISITAGKITFPFGQNNERLRFGIRNNLPTSVTIKPGDLLAYVQFFDLLGVKRKEYALSDRDLELYQARRHIAEDDGVWALQNSDSDSPV